MSRNRFMALVLISTGAFLIIVMTLFGGADIILEVTQFKETERKIYEVEEVKFLGGEWSFWTGDNNKIQVKTEHGDFVYKDEEVEFKRADEDGIRLEKISYKNKLNSQDEGIVLKIGQEQLKETQNKYVEYFEKNIVILD